MSGLTTQDRRDLARAMKKLPKGVVKRVKDVVDATVIGLQEHGARNAPSLITRSSRGARKQQADALETIGDALRTARQALSLLSPNARRELDEGGPVVGLVVEGVGLARLLEAFARSAEIASMARRGRGVPADKRSFGVALHLAVRLIELTRLPVLAVSTEASDAQMETHQLLARCVGIVLSRIGCSSPAAPSIEKVRTLLEGRVFVWLDEPRYGRIVNGNVCYFPEEEVHRWSEAHWRHLLSAKP